MLIKKIKFIIKNIMSSINYVINWGSKNSQNNLLIAELLRNVHSIEKGMCVNSPKLGYGQEKINNIFTLIDKVSRISSEYGDEAINMALSVLNEYITFHKQNNYTNSFIEDIKNYLETHKSKHEIKMGGTLDIKREDMIFDVEMIENFINSRHSIRDFEDTEVDKNKLLSALELAKRAPSACNRQGVRAYVIDAKGDKNLAQQLTGVGGFANSVDKFILITGKISAYRLDENYQYIVSASMYASYLTLTLHLYGLGACVVQRPVIHGKQWEKNRINYRIDDDEQIICLIAVGNLKESFKVPLSYRLINSDMIRFL